jgi:hypothetical protein
MLNLCAGMAHSVVHLAVSWMTRFQSSAGIGTLLFASVSVLALRSIYPPVQWVWKLLSVHEVHWHQSSPMVYNSWCCVHLSHPRTCRSERKWNRRQPHKGWFFSAVRPEPFLGVFRLNIRKTKHWIEKQHLALWRGPCSTWRQARELISGPDLAIGARLLFFNRTQYGVVFGLLTGHNTLRRHLHIMGLCNDPICRKCGTEEETSVHILCEFEALTSLKHAYLGSFFLDLEDISVLGMGAIWNFVKGTGLL